MPRANCLTCSLNVYAAPFCGADPYVIDTLQTTPTPCITFDPDMYEGKAVGFVSIMFTCVAKVPIRMCRGDDVTY
jgi:hypothetical protein